MSIPRLLNIPIVFLANNDNLTKIREAVRQLAASSFGVTVYVFSHYISSDTKANFCAQFPFVIWKEAGETMIYEELCANGKVMPWRVTFYLLPELLKESQSVVLWQSADEAILRKILNQISWWKQTHVSFIETEEFAYLNLNLLRQTKQFEYVLDVKKGNIEG